MGTSDGFFTTLRLAELTLRVADAGRVASFYEDQLGLQRLPGRDGHVRLSANGRESLCRARGHPKAGARA